MQEFIEELKNNKKVNIEKGLENKIDIDYVIERLEFINQFLVKNIEFFKDHCRNLTKEQDYRLTMVYDNLVSKGVFKNDK